MHHHLKKIRSADTFYYKSLSFLYGATMFVIESDKLIGSYTRVWLTSFTRNYITFRVKSCPAGGAKVALSSYLGLSLTETYQVVFGDDANQMTKIV